MAIEQLSRWIAAACFDDKLAWGLLYRATRDGFRPAAFHERCNGEGPRTVTVLRVQDENSDRRTVLGGFATVAWASDWDFFTDAAAFLFANVRDDEMFDRYPVRLDSVGMALYHYSSCG